MFTAAIHLRSMFAEELKLRRKIIEIGNRAAGLGLVMYHQGNFSTRLPGTDTILIKPTSIPYEDIQPEDIVKVDLYGNILDGIHEPSSEVLVHCTLYRTRPEMGGCAHVESPYLNALTALNIEVPNLVGNFVYMFEGQGMAQGPSLRSNTQEFADIMADMMGDRHGVTWKNHGMMCIGPDLEMAFNRCVAAEQAAHVYWLSLALQRGEPDLIPRAVQNEMLTAVRRGHGRG